MKLAEGQVIAERYMLDAPIGKGGMGVVWGATHLLTRKRVAIKVLVDAPEGPSPEARERLLREARAASAVPHPNVVAVHDVLELPDGTLALVMDRLDGESLATVLARDGRIPLGTFVRWMLPVVSALGTAHARGVVHRDLKPENIFLARDHRGTIDVKVLDFGIAKLMPRFGEIASAGALTNTGALLGTPSYMSPEQILGDHDVDHRADVWSLGVIFYECLTAERPTHDETVGRVIKTVLTGAIPDIAERAPELPGDVAQMVTQMLALDRKNRPEDLREVFEVLRAHGAGSAPTFARPSLPPRESPAPPPIEIEPLRAPKLEHVRVELPTLDERAILRPRRNESPASVRLIAVGSIGAVAAVGAAFALSARPAPQGASLATVAAGPGASSERCPAGMVLLEGGRFSMGTDRGKDDERPIHDVDVPTFCVDRTEVTVGAYTACVGRGACAPAARTVHWSEPYSEMARVQSGHCNAYEMEAQHAAITCVTWTQADAYCRASAQSKNGRLPTEAEWEYAARNGTRADPFPWGDAPLDPTRANLCDPGCPAAYGLTPETPPLFTSADGYTISAPVGSYPAGASRAGVVDLIGNVWEWTASPFCPYGSPRCAETSKVFRGGGWATLLALNAQPTTRLNSDPEFRYADVGFRCAADPR